MASTNKEVAAVRAYVLPITKKKKRTRKDKIIPPFDRVLVFDTETRTDLYQNMTFGYFTIYDNNRKDMSGMFFDPNIVIPKEKSILQEFSETKNIELWTLDEFRELFLKEAFDLQTLCKGLIFHLTYQELHLM